MAETRVARRRFGLYAITLARPGIALCAFLAVFISSGRSQPLDARTKIENAAFPVYLEFGSEPVAIVRAKKISTEYQRKGFFRIGVLPMLVCEGVRIELRDSQRLTNALLGVSELLETRRASKALELRHFSIEFQGESAPRLKAETVHLREGGRWALSKASYHTATNSIEIPEAMLEVFGARAGRLSWNARNGPASANLFNFSSNNPNSNQNGGARKPTTPGDIPALRPPALSAQQKTP